MDGFGQSFRIPDFWQAEALKRLREGKDVVLHAPTGAGKTFAFEMFFENDFNGRAVYTVPTRALANDKYIQWKSRGWRVGIATGDFSLDTDAPLVVATLETQKQRMFSGKFPDLLVIDEYQLLADPLRGANYELAIAMSPLNTRLLLMSGSVENTCDITAWLNRIGRTAALVSHNIRAVPLEEIVSTALPEVRAKGLKSMWARLAQRVIESDMAPLLIFAPRRAEAESIARTLAAELPCENFLTLPRRISEAAGKELSHMMRRRVAFHHSGLSAFQRAEVVEKYARDGDLKVVVATTGLGAGVNFSMRSVIIADRQYEAAGKPAMLRPDELLQMYGRAGRRGKDKIGFAIALPSKPRLSEARAARIKRVEHIDAPSIIRIMADALDDKKSPVEAPKKFCSRLFCQPPPDLGFETSQNYREAPEKAAIMGKSVLRTEILNSKNLWERKKPAFIEKLDNVLYYQDGTWIAFTKSPKAVASLKRGSPCELDGGRFGIRMAIATQFDEGWRLTKSFAKIVRRTKKAGLLKNFFADKFLSLKNLKRNACKFFEIDFAGANRAEFKEEDFSLIAKIDIGNSRIKCLTDSYGARLYNPPMRAELIQAKQNFAKLAGLSASGNLNSETPAKLWVRLGLIDRNCAPTLRGRIFSFFNGGEGLSIAAAIEDNSYDLRDLAFDIANLRAGHRFAMNQKSASGRLADASRLAYNLASIKGCLKAGIPITYGDGASEIMRELHAGANFQSLESDSLRRGDIERAYLEWLSLLRHISSLPDLNCPRWTEFKSACEKLLY